MRPRGERKGRRAAATASRAAFRAMLIVGLVALAGLAAGRMLRSPASPRGHAIGTSFPAANGGGPACRDTVGPGCAAAAATKAGVTVAWLPDVGTWRGVGLRAGGSAGHGWTTETLRDGDTTLALTSNSPELEVGRPVVVAGVTGVDGVAVRTADDGRRVQLVWSHGPTRYVADRTAATPIDAHGIAALVDVWQHLRYTSAVMGWA